ncbi:putative peptidyl-prolyl cis-trans isomerase Cbf2 precursor [Pseudovibrio axinellae]|uniref:Parvulin-like PPIase n=1 Tax=Pseudovibrio axinellae TaxID=989403 RepID=A0A165YX52_9HYPH|nr:peptidylprolyl isomerase [Pseudovibrio axinellae]KZL19315.1 putative peptidyl-prolyl cis-trans isomerase Cbf2 precursor [Pseudovibrio axinellae]SEQ41701.1 peptidyl-prolyl cis-trans isomerase C [Pseudovibrio axinellae]
MANLYTNPNLNAEAAQADTDLPSTKVPPKSAPVITQVSVNGVLISEQDILAEAQNHPAENPGQAVQAAARALVVRELLLQQANAIGLEITPHTSKNGSETDEDAAIRELIDQEVEVPSASKEECERYYQNNKARFSSEPIYEARHILFAAGSDQHTARSIAKTRAHDVIELLQIKPEAFADMAKEYSACPSKEAGGNLGQLTKGSTVPEFEAALQLMQAGQMTEQPIETKFGYHVIFLNRKIEGKAMPFENVEETIKAWLEAASWSKAVSQYIGILAGAAELEGVDLFGSQSPLVQ